MNKSSFPSQVLLYTSQTSQQDLFSLPKHSIESRWEVLLAYSVIVDCFDSQDFEQSVSREYC